VKLSDKYRQLAQQYYDKAKAKGVKFRNKDLRRLKSAMSTGTLNGLFDLCYCASAKIDENGELVLGNPIADLIPSSMDMWKLLKVDSDPNNNLYHQPVLLGTAHGIAYGDSDD
jgi:hypothetical protein